MSRFADLFKGFVSPTDEIQTPSFLKVERTAPPPSTFTPKAQISQRPVTVPPTMTSPEKTNPPVQSDKIDVPVYQSDSEWDVVQRSINLFADHANLSREVKQAFVKKWITELQKAEQTLLYRNEHEEAGHLGNELDRAEANSATGMLGTYQAMIHPGRQARMTDELKALQCVEKFDAGIIDLHLRLDFKMDLITIIIGTIEEQKAAAQKLFQKALKGQPEADKIYSATKALANSSEMRLNAAIKTAALKMDADKYQQLGYQAAESGEIVKTSFPSFVHKNQSTENTSPRRLARKESNQQENHREAAKPKVSESDWVNEQALKLFGKTS